MKKRWAMGLLCCLLLFQLAFPAKAAGSVYFVAAEESVLPVTDATMPFWANGEKYFTIQGPNGEKIEFVQIL